jgi:hypothetical protein
MQSSYIVVQMFANLWVTGDRIRILAQDATNRTLHSILRIGLHPLYGRSGGGWSERLGRQAGIRDGGMGGKQGRR